MNLPISHFVHLVLLAPLQSILNFHLNYKLKLRKSLNLI